MAAGSRFLALSAYSRLNVLPHLEKESIWAGCYCPWFLGRGS